MKKYEEMNDHELLLELLKEQKKNNFHEMVSACANAFVLLVILILSFMLVPKVSSSLNNINDLVKDINEVVLEADEAVSELDDMVVNVNKLVEENNEALNTTIQKASEIDIDSLNRSIQKLDDVIEPLSRFFSVFGGR